MDKMKVYLYGAGDNGRRAIRQLQSQYADTTIVEGIFDKHKIGEINDIPIKNEWKGIECDRESNVVIAIGDVSIVVSVNEELKKAGYTKIWWYLGYDRKRIEGDFLYEQCVSCRAWGGETLQYVEMHIMDTCNLNCRGCSHFSPIFKGGEPDFQEKIRDVKKLAEKFTHIMWFRIMGGEPLLNPAVGEYAAEIRKILPDTLIYIVTNGLLIPKIDSHILRQLRENNICFSISAYAPTHKRIKEITDRLDEENIFYVIVNEKEKFNRCLTISEDTKRKHYCASNGCTIIGNGKIARCPILMYIDEFNAYFGQNLPNEGMLSLDTPLKGNALIEYLKKEVPLCRHCILDEINWSVCGKNPQLEDFAVMD